MERNFHSVETMIRLWVLKEEIKQRTHTAMPLPAQPARVSCSVVEAEGKAKIQITDDSK